MTKRNVWNYFSWKYIAIILFLAAIVIVAIFHYPKLFSKFSFPEMEKNDPALKNYLKKLNAVVYKAEKLKGKCRSKNKIEIERGQRQFNELITHLRETTPKEYRQLFLEASFEYVPYMNPGFIYFIENKPDSTTLDSLYSTKAFIKYMSAILHDANSINPESPYHIGYYIDELCFIDDWLYDSPSLKAKLNLPEDYFSSLALKYADKTKDMNLRADLYNNIAHYWIKRKKKENAGKKLLNEIIEKFPTSRVVQSGGIDRALRHLKLKPNSITMSMVAPQFAIQSISGDSIRLKDFKGQFVFLDFWGTWCGPCRRDIPNVKKLVDAKIVNVIGIANDKPDILKKYIKQNGLTYRNAIATDDILNAYGIIGYPTSFLISPDSKIIAQKLHGENLVDQVQKKINEWQKVL